MSNKLFIDYETHTKTYLIVNYAQRKIAFEKS